MLVAMSLWMFLALLAVGILWTLVTFFRPSEKKLNRMFYMAAFLAVFDWVFETTGLYLGYWQSKAAWFFLGPAVPAEVFVIALCAGATLNLLFPKFSWRTAIPTSLVIASVGAGIEAILEGLGNVSYIGGWTSYHAFVSYFFGFALFQFVNDFIESRK